MIKKDYPYMYARVSAKKAKLYDSSEYEKLLKMGPNEISRKMEEGAYKEDINELGARYDGVQLVELALARNMAREMSELAEMADGDLQKVMEIYLRRYDIMTYKRILRAKKSKDQIHIEDYLMPVGSIKSEKIQELAEKDFQTVKELIKFKASDQDYQSYIKDAETLAEIEKGLDQAYYDEMEEIYSNMPSSNLKKFISEEVIYENLKIVLRMKKYDMPEDEIRERLLASKNGLIVEEALSREFEDAIDYVVEELGLEVEERLEKVEHAIEVKKLGNALKMLHREPLGLSSILGYVVAKITEVKNLRMLLRAKETGIQNQETIRRQLVLPA